MIIRTIAMICVFVAFFRLESGNAAGVAFWMGVSLIWVCGGILDRVDRILERKESVCPCGEDH